MVIFLYFCTASTAVHIHGSGLVDQEIEVSFQLLPRRQQLARHIAKAENRAPSDHLRDQRSLDQLAIVHLEKRLQRPDHFLFKINNLEISLYNFFDFKTFSKFT